MRGVGDAFVSATAIISGDPHPFATAEERDGPMGKFLGLFAEYGYNEKLTLRGSFGQNEAGTQTTTFAAQVPLGEQIGDWRSSLSSGGIYDGERFGTFASVAVGRGFPFRDNGGWMSFEFEHSDIPTSKAVATVGVTVEDGRMLISQIRWQKDSRNEIVTFAPSVAAPLGGGRTVQVGLAQDILEGERFALSLSLWQRF